MLFVRPCFCRIDISEHFPHLCQAVNETWRKDFLSTITLYVLLLNFQGRFPFFVILKDICFKSVNSFSWYR